jgi:hypothetical protein
MQINSDISDTVQKIFQLSVSLHLLSDTDAQFFGVTSFTDIYTECNCNALTKFKHEFHIPEQEIMPM